MTPTRILPLAALAVILVAGCVPEADSVPTPSVPPISGPTTSVPTPSVPSIPGATPSVPTPSGPIASVPAVATCRAEDAARLVGQINPSEAAIKAMTGADTVRQAGPNQPLTMDYRFDRVTVIKDPATGRILRATCG